MKIGERGVEWASGFKKGNKKRHEISQWKLTEEKKNH